MHFTLVFSFIFFSFAVIVSGNVHGQLMRKHIHRRGENATTVLDKRFENARFSYYEAGLGACGQVNSASDFIVALNSDQFDSGHYCFQTITITCRGKTTQAQITDRCPGCPYGGLDFSEGLFQYFASTGDGIIYGTWDFGNGAPPITTQQQPSSTSVASATSTQASSSSSSMTSLTAATSASSTESKTTEPSAVSSPPTQVVRGTLEQVYLALMSLGELVSS